MINILPINYIDTHIENSTCKCNPKVEILSNGDLMVIHNAFDCRERKEELLNDVSSN